jgi:hypothetical protein
VSAKFQLAVKTFFDVQFLSKKPSIKFDPVVDDNQLYLILYNRTQFFKILYQTVFDFNSPQLTTSNHILTLVFNEHGYNTYLKLTIALNLTLL